MSIDTPRSGGLAYVGFNRGEFGGGLLVIDLVSGEVRPAGRRPASAPADATLSVDHDPVTAVIADPREDACVLVASGIAHLSLSGGRVLKVCGENVTVELRQEFGERYESRLIMQTEPVYGLSADRLGYWAVTPQALYRFGGPGPARQPVTYSRIGDLLVNRNTPGVTIICGRTDQFARCASPLVAANP